MRFVLLALCIFAMPLVSHAGSQTFYSSGTFYVPAYSSLTVYVYAAGGGGGGSLSRLQQAGNWGSPSNVDGSGGGHSYFGGVAAYGGGGGSGAWGYPQSANGAAGSGSGGSVYPGSGSAGGAGQCAKGLCAGNGGAGGLVVASYSAGQLGVGSGVGVTVGGGGAGGGEGSSGTSGYVSISWSDPPAPSCSISVSPSAVNQGNYSYVSWSSSYADHWFYISNIGYVGGSGGTWLAPGNSTSYSGTVYGYGGYGYCGNSVTVYQPCSLPWGGSIANGQSATAYQSGSVPFGSSCLSQTRSCSNGSLSGSYSYASCSMTPAASCTLGGVTVAHGQIHTFYSSSVAPVASTCSAVSQSRTCNNGTLSGTASYQYGSCSVAAPTCSISFSTNPIIQGQTSATVSWTSNNAAHFLINNIGWVTPNVAGSVVVSPLQSTDYTGTVSGGAIVVLTSGTSWTVPSDWNSSANTIHVIGGGGGSGEGDWLEYGGGGGGGGAYSRVTNVAFTPGASVPLRIGSGGAAGTDATNGGAGGDTYFNGATCLTSSVCAKAGTGGGRAAGAGGASGSGGSAAAGVGSIKYSGGNGGVGAHTGGSGGGGGAAGPNGAGGSQPYFYGGTGGGGTGGLGGVYVPGSNYAIGGGGPGGQGTEFDSGHGSGGGGAGGNGNRGGAGGLYGGGAGGGGSTGSGGISSAAAAGAQGIIVITYAPTGTPTAVTCRAPSGTPLGTLNVSCAPLYSCSGNNVQFTNSSCQTTTVASCTAPGHCTPGQSSCQYDTMTFNPFSATTTAGNSFTASGHLVARPGLVRPGDRSRLFWNVLGAQSCTVTGTNGDSWTRVSTQSWGVDTLPITSLTRYTMNCTAYDGVTPPSLTETATVLLAPEFREN